MVGSTMIDWKGLKSLGWPYSKTHTMRMMQEEIEVSRKGKNGVREYFVIKNPDPFPRCMKLGYHRNSHLVWPTPEVAEYFKAHGLPIPDKL
jgi:hypothetical protein